MINELKNNGKFWKYLTNFWAIIIYAAIIYDFIKDNAFVEFLGPITAIYIAALAIYAGDKEFERWHHSHNKRHPGEMFVAAWTILVVGILILDFIFNKPYKMPSEVISAYIAVLGVLAITKKSKSLYNEDIEIHKGR
ncbi:hypothetical protein HZC33_01300 [Candidatus Wolfebacteria bacterium]|nr:hypothetical protein [Candidatus Wolfebacteria bacterium]